MQVTVEDKTEYSCDITPSQALAYVRRTIGGIATMSLDEACLVFGDPLSRNCYHVPLDEGSLGGCSREEAEEAFRILVEDIADHEGCKPSETLFRMSVEPVVPLDELTARRFKKTYAARQTAIAVVVEVDLAAK